MKRFLISTFLLFTFFNSIACCKDSLIYYTLPDSVKAISFLAEIKIQSYTKNKFFSTGIKTDAVSLTIQNYFGKRQIDFSSLVYPNSKTPAINTHFGRKLGDLIFNYDWQVNETYKLLIAQATDSAGNFSLYSGYIFLPKENKWKLIGTAKIEGKSNTIQQPTLFYLEGKKQNLSITTGQVWCQRQNGSWKNMLQTNLAPPVVNLLSHVDSLQQLAIDKGLIKVSTLKPINPELPSDIKQGFIDDTTYKNVGGIYYKMLKEGTGRQVSVNDTVTVFYKGYLFKDGSVFDETKEKPAIFPLKRLIVGWQIGVPLCKVGGKIKIIVPSNLAYSIRTRAAKIPPNSILVFEIEVVDAKAPQ